MCGMCVNLEVSAGLGPVVYHIYVNAVKDIYKFIIAMWRQFRFQSRNSLDKSRFFFTTMATFKSFLSLEPK